METQISKGRRITGWVLNGIAVAMFIFSGIAKLTAAESVVEMFAGTGYEDTLMLLGVIEMVCVIAFLIPSTRGFGTILMMTYLGGAIAFDWGAENTQQLTASVGVSVLFWIGVFLRKPGTFK